MDPATQAFTQAALYTDDLEYTLIHLPAPAIMPAAVVLAEIGEVFSALIADKDEVTLLLAQDDWNANKKRLPDHKTSGPYRLITFDLELDRYLVLYRRGHCRARRPYVTPHLAAEKHCANDQRHQKQTQPLFQQPKSKHTWLLPCQDDSTI